jgi:hypothetical protein
MRKDVVGATDRVTLRVTPDINRRADALVKKLAKDPAVHGLTRITRAVVLKRALVRGLEALEAEYGGK